MSFLTEERQALKETLAATSVQTFDYLPERFTPAAFLVLPGSPYITSGERFGSHEANFDVWLVGPSGDNKKVTDFLDQTIQAGIGLMLQEGWTVNEVQEPFLYQMQNGNYLSVVISVSTSVDFH